MSRYNSNNSGSTGNDYNDDSVTIKLQQYAALRVTPIRVGANEHSSYGTSLIVDFEETEIVDGIVFQRDDKPDTYKVFSADKFFNLNPENGRVYERYDAEEEEYESELSAQDVLDHPRVAGFSESFGGTDYFYTPVGVLIEEAEDIAMNDSLDVDTTGEPAIVLGDSTMLLGNKTWTRTFAKKITESGNDIIRDNGDDPAGRGEEETNPKYDDYDWLSTQDPTLRSAVDGRSLELWLTEETFDPDGDGSEVSFTVPNLMDTKTGEPVTIDNDESESAESGDETTGQTAAATDGGATAAQPQQDTQTDTTEEAPLPDGVPEMLDDLLDYMARNGQTSADEIRSFAEDEVDDPNGVDWEAASEVAQQRT